MVRYIIRILQYQFGGTEGIHVPQSLVNLRVYLIPPRIIHPSEKSSVYDMGEYTPNHTGEKMPPDTLVSVLLEGVYIAFLKGHHTLLDA